MRCVASVCGGDRGSGRIGGGGVFEADDFAGVFLHLVSDGDGFAGVGAQNLADGGDGPLAGDVVAICDDLIDSGFGVGGGEPECAEGGVGDGGKAADPGGERYFALSQDEGKAVLEGGNGYGLRQRAGSVGGFAREKGDR